MKFSHPHKYLLHYLKSLKDWMSAEVWAKYPVARVSWSLLQVSTGPNSNLTPLLRTPTTTPGCLSPSRV